MGVTTPRRLALRVAAKLLGLVALGAVAWVLFGSLVSPPRPREPMAIPVEGLPPGEVVRVLWEGRRVLVLRRTPETMQRLEELEPRLADPGSLHSEQPRAMTTLARSAPGEFFVALDYDPDFGCPLEAVSAADPTAPRPWLGGFHAVCSNSWFDPAGRVYKDQRTIHNLRVPPYRLEQGRVLLQE